MATTRCVSSIVSQHTHTPSNKTATANPPQKKERKKRPLIKPSGKDWRVMRSNNGETISFYFRPLKQKQKNVDPGDRMRAIA